MVVYSVMVEHGLLYMIKEKCTNPFVQSFSSFRNFIVATSGSDLIYLIVIRLPLKPTQYFNVLWVSASQPKEFTGRTWNLS